MLETIGNFLKTTGIAKLFFEFDELGNIIGSRNDWLQYLVMYLIVGGLFYLAVVKKFEPLLLLPIAFGMLLADRKSVV